MSIWEGLLLALTALVAVRMLVGMMRQRSAAIIHQVQKQVDAHIAREEEAKKQRKKQAATE